MRMFFSFHSSLSTSRPSLWVSNDQARHISQIAQNDIHRKELLIILTIPFFLFIQPNNNSLFCIFNPNLVITLQHYNLQNLKIIHHTIYCPL